MDRIGNYRIDGERSRDAKGVVYEARHLVLPRRAIIKITHEPGAPMEGGSIAGFAGRAGGEAAGAIRAASAVHLLREACTLEALEHPGIIRVFESGLLPDRRAWFAHERIEGSTVADLFTNGPLDPATASALLRDIAEILEHAHRRGVVHCGLRPDRLVVTGRARGFPLCLADWSDARIHDTSAPVPARGPEDFTAPELVNGDAIDDRVDVFALGVIAYQALTGDLPFDGAWIATVADTQHVPTEVRCPDAPPRLAGLVDQMLAWDRWDRPSSAEVRAELSAIATELAAPLPPRPSMVRIRKPKWTPALTFGDGEPDIVATETGDADSKPTKSS